MQLVCFTTMFYVHSYVLIICLLFVNCKGDFPTDLSCSGVAHRSSVTLRGCTFLNKTDIECHLFGIASQISFRYLPTSAVSTLI